MKKSMSLLAVLCLGGILASGTAQAAPYYSTNFIIQTVTNDVYRSWENFVFNQFNEVDPAKGQLFDLLGVTVTVNYSTLTGIASLKNDGEGDASIIGYSSSFQVKETNAPLGYSALSNSIASIGTTPDWNTVTVTAGQTVFLTLDSGQHFVDPLTPNVQNIADTYFSAYRGAGTIAFALRNPMLLTSDGEDYQAVTSGAGAFTSMTVTYAYGVPEPSTYVLFGLGGLALVVAYRRKRAA